MTKYLDPKTDLAFKKVFGEHKDLLISFLNSVLPLPNGTEIDSLEYLSTSIGNSIMTVRCTSNSEKDFVVIIQMYWTDTVGKSALFDACEAYSHPVEKYNFLPVYTLGLVNAIAFPECPEDYYHTFTFAHNKHNELDIEDISLVFIELPKFKPDSVTDKKLMSLWLRFLTEVNDKTQQVSPELSSNAYISKALSLLEPLAIDHSV